MELGALVCAAKNPRCAECPLRDDCVARCSGRTDELPRRLPRRESVDVSIEVAYVRRNEDVLLVRRTRTQTWLPSCQQPGLVACFRLRSVAANFYPF